MAGEDSDADDWDTDFINQLVQAEELILSARPSRHPPPPTSSAVSTFASSAFSDATSQSPLPAFSASILPRRLPPPTELSYSPPRELSQRIHETYHTGGVPEFVDTFAPHATDTAKERELGKLQKELDRVSKQLSHLEKDCSELRKERAKNLEQLKVLNLRIEANAEVNNTKNMEMDGVVRPLDPGISAICHDVKPSNKQLESWKKCSL